MTGQSLEEALARVRPLLLDDATLVRASATGRRRGAEPPRWRRVELRYVDLKRGRRLQVTSYDATQAFVTNHDDAATEVEELLGTGFGHWHVETATGVVALRVTKKGTALVHARARAEATEPDHGHDRAKQRMLPATSPVLRELGITDAQGRVKPSRQAKYRQVEELVRALATAVDDATAAGHLRRPTEADPLRVVDLGCGNAYLGFAALAHLREERELPAVLVGVDVKAQSREHNEALAARLGWTEHTRFVVAGIDDVVLEERPDVVLALHACDTASDDALARVVEWEAPLALVAPCCHHDVSAQLRQADLPAPQAALIRDGILRERFADTLTDSLRAALLRAVGYRVEVVEFVESRHTPRNTLLRATRTGRPSTTRDEHDVLAASWGVRPHLAVRLAELAQGSRP